MKKNLRIVMAQLDLLVGDVPGNVDRVIENAARARDAHAADLVVFPELTLTGYPPEDLLFHSGLKRQVAAGLDKIATEVTEIGVVVGFPEYVENGIYNACTLLENGSRRANYRKQIRPNYSVFDEKRYFLRGERPCIVNFQDIPLALTICEDLWRPGPATQAAAAGAKLLINISASPYEIDKQTLRTTTFGERARDAKLPLLTVNLVGGQDELVFDGSSFSMAANGDLMGQAPAFQEELYPANFTWDGATVKPVQSSVHAPAGIAQSVYQAVVLGARDYAQKNHFPGAIVGLSGGIDSALTLAIAVDALGADNVIAVMMPSRYTSDISIELAKQQAEAANLAYHVIPIETTFNAFVDTLSEVFSGYEPDTTEENIQARCRGVILMAMSNKTGKLLFTTGNKSESAVGYATLYGDMAGGFAPIRDVSKTLVYRLAHYRNSLSPVIPEDVISREPSAELAADQRDADTLPPYHVLDAILEAYVEDDKTVAEVINDGFDQALVERVVVMVQRNEYKRRQGPPGVRISRRAFGRDRRYPITSGYA